MDAHETGLSIGRRQLAVGVAALVVAVAGFLYAITQGDPDSGSSRTESGSGATGAQTRLSPSGQSVVVHNKVTSGATAMREGHDAPTLHDA
jgi:hypothetical protein